LLIVGALWLKNFESFFGFTAWRLKSLKSPFKYKKALKLILLILRSLEGVGVRSLFPFPSLKNFLLDFYLTIVI
jgi:hypothetical protein